MIAYKVLYKNYDLRKGEFIGALVERRKDLRGKTKVETGLRWAKLTFGNLVEDKHKIFVVPHELRFGGETERLVEKEVFAK
jgi:hypothetical protein